MVRYLTFTYFARNFHVLHEFCPIAAGPPQADAAFGSQTAAPPGSAEARLEYGVKTGEA